MGREIKIGLLAIIGIGLFIWGYKYLLGTNVLKRSNTFYIEYQDIDHLQVSAPVMIHGFQVGTVTNIKLNPENLRTIIVTISVDNDIKLPPNTVAELRSVGMMGGKSIELAYVGLCDGDCLESGSQLKGKSFGFIQSMVEPSEVEHYLATIEQGIGGVIDSINYSLLEEDPESGLGKTVADLRIAIANLKQTTIHINRLFSSASGKLVTVLEDVSTVTGTLKTNNEEIAGLLQNANSITAQLANARLDTTILAANRALGSTGNMMESLEATLVKADLTFDQLQALLKGINAGNGTLGSLTQSKELYDNLNRASINLDLLLQDFRLNPKRYVNVSVFGKKQKDYNVPEQDPAFDSLRIEK
ncbi:MAG: MCE family protein [Saprospiraceae bacterium]|nr:MCE family protein [Saprospiraceae bacterium]